MIKVLCCEHFISKLEERNIPLKKKKHFNYGCEHHLDTFVIKYLQHEMFYERFDVEAGKCYCKELGPFELCSRCISKMYILNYIVEKVCVATPPFHILKKMKTLEDYLNEFPTVAFFYFKKETGKVDVSLDNPRYNGMNGVENAGN